MVPADDLPRAMALGQTAGSVGMMLAPALGGLLMGRFGLRVPLLADAGSYLAIAAAGRLIRTRRGAAPRPLRASPGDAGVMRIARLSGHGVRRGDGGTATGAWGVRRDPLVRAAVVLVGAVVAAASLVNVAEVFFVRATLHSTAGVYGLIDSVVDQRLGGGRLVGGPPPPVRPRDWPGSSSARWRSPALGVALIAAAPAVAWLVPVSVLGGLGNGGVNIAAGILLGRRAPAALRGRAFAVFGAVVNGADRGWFRAGWRAAHCGAGAGSHRSGRAGRPGGHRGVRAVGPAGQGSRAGPG